MHSQLQKESFLELNTDTQGDISHKEEDTERHSDIEIQKVGGALQS